MRMNERNMAQSMDIAGSKVRGFAMLAELLRAMRPKDWIKNTFVLLAIAFSQKRLWLQPHEVLMVIVAFVLFCMVASAIYLINDLLDMEKDRAHPKKRCRPLASGRLSPTVAKVTAAILLIVALPTAFLIDYNPAGRLIENFDFGLALFVYLLIQGFAYSYYLKHVVI